MFKTNDKVAKSKKFILQRNIENKPKKMMAFSSNEGKGRNGLFNKCSWDNQLFKSLTL